MMSIEAALLFDSKKETARLVHFDGELDTLRELLGADSIDTIRLDKQHIIIVDDQSFIKRLKTGFRVKLGKRAVGFAGNGLLVGNLYGGNAPITLNIADLEIEVLKFEYDNAEES
jgi:hypothetical protein